MINPAGTAEWWECSPPTNVGRGQFQPGVICGLSLLMVLALLQGFFSGFYGFLPSTKKNIYKYQFDQDREPAWKPAKTDVASSLNIVCGFPLAEERTKWKALISHMAGSLSTSVWGVFSHVACARFSFCFGICHYLTCPTHSPMKYF